MAIWAGCLTLTPLERMAVPNAVSGADGENRSVAFCYIQARHDLEAVRAYRNKYRDQPKTLRAYTKELEHFLSLIVDDCEASVDAYAMRHSFGTQTVADEVPVDVVQKVLGHAPLQTTSI